MRRLLPGSVVREKISLLAFEEMEDLLYREKGHIIINLIFRVSEDLSTLVKIEHPDWVLVLTLPATKVELLNLSQRALDRPPKAAQRAAASCDQA